MLTSRVSCCFFNFQHNICIIYTLSVQCLPLCCVSHGRVVLVVPKTLLSLDLLIFVLYFTLNLLHENTSVGFMFLLFFARICVCLCVALSLAPCKLSTPPFRNISSLSLHNLPISPPARINGVGGFKVMAREEVNLELP